MKDRRRALFAAALGLALGAAAALAADALSLRSGARTLRARLDRSERARIGAESAAAMDSATRRAFDELSRFGAEVSGAWLKATEAPGARKQRDAAKAWERVVALLAGPTAPPGARVAVYEEEPEGAAEPLRLLGWAEAPPAGPVPAGAHVVLEGLGTWKGRMPSATLRKEAEGREVADLADLLWFGAEGDAPVRVHQHSLYSHEYEEDDKTTTVVRGVDVSAPFAAPPGLSAEVRCDVVDGALDRSLSPRAVPGRAAAGDDVTATALLPGDAPWRLPVGGTTPRATVRAPAPGSSGAAAAPSPLPLVAAGALAALAVAAGIAAWRLRRAAAAPDVSGEAAHEMKTPLTAMRGAIEVALRRERTPAEYRETLAATLEEVKGLQNVIGSVLLLTRGAETPPAEEPVEMTEVVRAEAERVHLASPDRHVSLASVKGPRVVVGDPSLLSRAVANLLDNAALHSVAGGAIRVRVEAVRRELIVSVEDDGPGIPASRREKVFERFWRGPEVGARGIPGSGLGLPIARWIAEVHGGSLVLDPAVADRARFVLRLPLGAG